MSIKPLFLSKTYHDENLCPPVSLPPPNDSLDALTTTPSTTMMQYHRGFVPLAGKSPSHNPLRGCRLSTRGTKSDGDSTWPTILRPITQIDLRSGKAKRVYHVTIHFYNYINDHIIARLYLLSAGMAGGPPLFYTYILWCFGHYSVITVII